MQIEDRVATEVGEAVEGEVGDAVRGVVVVGDIEDADGGVAPREGGRGRAARDGVEEAERFGDGELYRGDAVASERGDAVQRVESRLRRGVEDGVVPRERQLVLADKEGVGGVVSWQEGERHIDYAVGTRGGEEGVGLCGVENLELEVEIGRVESDVVPNEREAVGADCRVEIGVDVVVDEETVGNNAVASRSVGDSNGCGCVCVKC